MGDYIMSNLVVTNLKSKNALPPVVRNSSDVEVGQFCRAWVNFNGTGTVAIRASFNVSSLIDNGPGDYTINLTTAMSDANYATTCSSRASGANGWVNLNSAQVPTTTTARISSVTVSAGAIIPLDADYMNAAIFR